jgi:hypothetical protein
VFFLEKIPEVILSAPITTHKAKLNGDQSCGELSNGGGRQLRPPISILRLRQFLLKIQDLFDLNRVKLRVHA